MISKSRKLDLNSVLIFFSILLVISQIFLLKHLVNNTFQNDILISNELNSLSNNLNFKNSTNFISVDIPIFPEIENFKNLNKVVSINDQTENIEFYVGQNEIVFNYFFIIILFVHWFIFKNKYNLFFLLLLINFYIYLVFDFKFSNLILFITSIFISKIINYLRNLQDKENLIIFFVVLIGVLFQLNFLNKEVIDWDISTFLVMGKDINNGYLPYENQFELKPVLIFYLYSLYDLITDGQLKFIKILNDLPVFLLIVLNFKTVSRKFDNFTATITSLLFGAFMSLPFYGGDGFSELYALIPISITFYLLENKNKFNFFIIGLLISISTLFNLGTVFFFFFIFILIFKNWRNKIFLFISGFALPHFLFLIIYYLNNLIKIYIDANLLLPSIYNQSTLYEKFYTAGIGLFNSIVSIKDINFIFFIFVVLSILMIVYSKFFSNNNKFFNYLNYYLSACIFHYVFAGPTVHHFIFLIYFFSVSLTYIQRDSFKNALLTLVIVFNFQLFISNAENIKNNIINFSTIENTYTLNNISNYLLNNFEIKTAVAFDHNLIFYYLDLENIGYFSHPILYFDYVYNYFFDDKKEDEIFQELVNKDPDLIICNSNRYNFCNNIDRYVRVEKFNKGYDFFIKKKLN